MLDLGRRRYGETLLLQRELVERRLADRSLDDVLLLVEHEPVVTLGRGTRAASLPSSPAELERRGLEVFEVERGGDVTWHGPGQLVGYPILDLTGHRQDLHWYLRQLEAALVEALGGLGIAAGAEPGLTGVWTGGRKIASIGIHVRQLGHVPRLRAQRDHRSARLRGDRPVRHPRRGDDERRAGAWRLRGARDAVDAHP